MIKTTTEIIDRLGYTSPEVRRKIQLAMIEYAKDVISHIRGNIEHYAYAEQDDMDVEVQTYNSNFEDLKDDLI